MSSSTSLSDFLCVDKCSSGYKTVDDHCEECLTERCEIGTISIEKGTVYHNKASHLEDIVVTLHLDDLITDYSITQWTISYQDENIKQ